MKTWSRSVQKRSPRFVRVAVVVSLIAGCIFGISTNAIAEEPASQASPQWSEFISANGNIDIQYSFKKGIERFGHQMWHWRLRNTSDHAITIVYTVFGKRSSGSSIVASKWKLTLNAHTEQSANETALGQEVGAIALTQVLVITSDPPVLSAKAAAEEKKPKCKIGFDVFADSCVCPKETQESIGEHGRMKLCFVSKPAQPSVTIDASVLVCEHPPQPYDVPLPPTQSTSSAPPVNAPAIQQRPVVVKQDPPQQRGSRYSVTRLFRR